jgi:hypothetical protein
VWQLAEWAAQHGVEEAYAARYAPSHLAEAHALRFVVFLYRETWLSSRCRWRVWPNAEPEPDLDRGAQLSRRVVVRVQDAFRRSRFIEAPAEPTRIPDVDGASWAIAALREGRLRERSERSATVEGQGTWGFEAWSFQSAWKELMGARPHLFRWPREVLLER